MEIQNTKIAIIGGTGKEGKGLAYRWAKAGYPMIIGSRQKEKAEATAEEINKMLPNQKNKVTGMENLDAVKACDIAVLTVPFTFHKDMLTQIKPVLGEKILIDVTVPIVPPKVTKVQMPPDGSAAMEAKKILGEDAKIVSAFQNISYEKLLTDQDVECDVLVSGDKESRQLVIKMIEDIGLTAWDAGPLENSVVAEGLTSILIGINKKLGIQSAGIKITGIAS